MKKLYILLIKSFLGPFILTFFIALFLLLMQFLWKYIDELVGKGFDFVIIVEFLLYALVTLIPLALPLAVLLSSIMVLGNMAEYNELTALKSAGISLYRIMFPLLFLVTFIAGGAFFFSNNIMPLANLKMYSLMHDITQKKPELSLKEGVFSNLSDNYALKVESINNKSGILYNLIIYDHSEGFENRNVTLADSALIETTADDRNLIFTFYNGCSYIEMENARQAIKSNSPHRTTYFEKQRLLIDMSGLNFKRTDESLFKNNYQMYSISQLNKVVDSLHVKQQNTLQKQKEKLEHSHLKSLPVTLAFYNNTANKSNNSLNIDSLYNSMPNADRQRVINQAMNNVQAIQKTLASNAIKFKSENKWIKCHEIEWHRKFTLSLACILLFFIGAPLGAIIRKGGLGMSVVVSVLFFVFYYVVNISGEKSVKIGEWSAWFGMWLSSILLFPLGVLLTYKASNDTVKFDFTNVVKFIKAIKQKIL